MHFESTFLDGSSVHTYCGWVFLATCLAGSNNFVNIYVNYQIIFKSWLTPWYLISNATQTEGEIFSVYGEIWTWISKVNNRHVSQLGHAATPLCAHKHQFAHTAMLLTISLKTSLFTSYILFNSFLKMDYSWAILQALLLV
jgi:hypothetical protein